MVVDKNEANAKSDVSPAIRRLQNKRDVPKIDFTIFKTEDGSVVSTQERVIKGTLEFRCCGSSAKAKKERKKKVILKEWRNLSYRGSCACRSDSYRRRVLEQRATWVARHCIP